MTDSFKTAEQLGISQWEYDGLLATLRSLEQDKFISEASIIRSWGDQQQNLNRLLFNMGYQAKPFSCGTVACIGGHVSLHSQGVDIESCEVFMTKKQTEEAESYVNQHDPDSNWGKSTVLTPLYWPSSSVFSDSTKEDACSAIRNFLRSGDPKWDHIMEQRRLTDEPAEGAEA